MEQNSWNPIQTKLYPGVYSILSFKPLTRFLRNSLISLSFLGLRLLLGSDQDISCISSRQKLLGNPAYKMLGKLKHKITKSQEKSGKVTTVDLCVEADCPDGGYGWIICLAAAMIQFIILGIHNNFGILYTYLISDLRAEPSDAGTICYILALERALIN